MSIIDDVISSQTDSMLLFISIVIFKVLISITCITEGGRQYWFHTHTIICWTVHSITASMYIHHTYTNTHTHTYTPFAITRRVIPVQYIHTTVIHRYIKYSNSQIMHTSGSQVSRYIVVPGHRIFQFLVLGSSNVKPLLCVEEDALWHSMEMAAELAQHITTPLVDYSQMDEPTGSLPGWRGG